MLDRPEELTGALLEIAGDRPVSKAIGDNIDVVINLP
jgi:hypothetical protein